MVLLGAVIIRVVPWGIMVVVVVPIVKSVVLDSYTMLVVVPSPVAPVLIKSSLVS